MKKECELEGCQRPVDARGLCHGHYYKNKHAGVYGGKSCSEVACVRLSTSRGLCATHYQAARRRGEFSKGKCGFSGCKNFLASYGLCHAHYAQKREGKELVPLRRDRGEWGEWLTNAKGYIYRTRQPLDAPRESQLQHRMVMEESLGRELLRHEEVHHLNGDRGDNRLENLELWSTRQPKGQRVEDKIAWAKEILSLYEPDALN